MKALCKGLQLKYSDIEHLSTSTLSEWIEEKKTNTPDAKRLLLLDVREEDEYNVSHLQESVRISPSATDNQIKEVIKENIEKIKKITPSEQPTKIICYCSIGYRSSILARRIKDLKSNIESPVHIYNLEGSLFKWANESRPMMDSYGHLTKYAHPYSTFYGGFLNSDLRKRKTEESTNIEKY